LGAGSLLMQQPADVTPTPTSMPLTLVQDDRARVRESSQLLQALGRDDGYILAADFVDWNR
jgi:hypothetical protein